MKTTLTLLITILFLAGCIKEKNKPVEPEPTTKKLVFHYMETRPNQRINIQIKDSATLKPFISFVFEDRKYQTFDTTISVIVPIERPLFWYIEAPKFTINDIDLYAKFGTRYLYIKPRDF